MDFGKTGISGFNGKAASATDILKNFSGNIGNHVAVVVDIQNISPNLTLVGIDVGLSLFNLLDFRNRLADDLQGTSSGQMAGHPYKYIQNWKITRRGSVDIDLHHFLRSELPCNQRQNTIIGANKVMPVQFQGNVPVFRS